MDMKQVNIPQMHLESSGIHFNPTDLLYNFFGKNPKELKAQEMKKDDTVTCLNLSLTEKLLLLLVSIKKEILQRCNYSDSFIKTANDLQIMDAISGCYEEYKILKKR
jgi:hypothetical protein